MVISIGVLHHTGRCHEGIGKACSLVKQGGYVVIGLYHHYGRAPFLAFFENMKKAGAGDDERFAKYRELDNRHYDETAARSWFNDQVLHPFESQHTLEEIVPVLRENGCTVTSTSINNFERFTNIAPLYAMEKTLYAKGEQFLSEGKYFHGFFTVIARKEKQP